MGVGVGHDDAEEKKVLTYGSLLPKRTYRYRSKRRFRKFTPGGVVGTGSLFRYFIDPHDRLKISRRQLLMRC